MEFKELQIKKLGNEFFLKREGFISTLFNIFGSIKNNVIYFSIFLPVSYFAFSSTEPKRQAFGMAITGSLMFYVLSVFFIIAMYAQGGGAILRTRFSSQKKKDYNKDLELNLRKYFGRDFKYFDCFSYGGSYPCALGYDGKQILILDQGEYVFANKSDMRSYGWRMHSPGVPATFHGGTFGQRTGAEWAENINVAQENAMKTNNSGFFVNCKSIDKPDWFIATGMGQERVCKKWDEIFHQINDGTLPINP